MKVTGELYLHLGEQTKKLIHVLKQLPYSTAFTRDDGLIMMKVDPIISMMVMSLQQPKLN